MEQTIDEFFHDFRQGMLAGAEANSAFQLEEFVGNVADELVETGFVEGFEFCHYRAQRGLRIDGYWFDDEGNLDLFVADFESRAELASLTRTDVEAAFRRLSTFLENCINRSLYAELDIVTPEYGLARQIYDRKGLIRKVNFLLLSERSLSDRFQSMDEGEVAGIPATYHIWDMSRLNRQRSARGGKEELDINFVEMFGTGIACLPAHMGAGSYQSYLVVMPARIVADLYGKFGGKLLEQNVRAFLQARGKVNAGIRATIMTEPSMFFAYNNGITATAQEVEATTVNGALQITRIRDLQIVNGGQTTASLFHTRRKDKASLDGIFVQLKLSVIDSAESEVVVPRISEYANTQNRVNAADFFSNHPFHIRMQDFSRRLWAPPRQGEQRETKWFYERARGQYADAQAKLTPAEQRRFKAESPKPQVITKTDLAKFENVWDDHPRWVNLGSQKNFARYAGRIGKEWSASPDGFNELYFRNIVARALIFRATEAMVSQQPWYNGGYRANIVAYAIAAINEICHRRNVVPKLDVVWTKQAVPPGLIAGLAHAAVFVNEDIVLPPQGISNPSEWAKREACWVRIQGHLDELEGLLPDDFWNETVSLTEQKSDFKAAKKVQKIDNGINAQKRVLEVPAQEWSQILAEGVKRKIFTPKEIGVVEVATKIPQKIPTEKQCAILMNVLAKAQAEGFHSPRT